MSDVGWAPFPDFSLISQVNSKELAALKGPICQEALAAAVLHCVYYAAPVTGTQLKHIGRQKFKHALTREVCEITGCKKAEPCICLMVAELQEEHSGDSASRKAHKTFLSC